MTGANTIEDFPYGFPESVPIENGLAAEVLRICLQPSGSVNMLDDSERPDYFDVDLLSGFDRQIELDEQRPNALAGTVDTVTNAIKEISAARQTDALAFLVRGKSTPGPFGIGALASSLSISTGLPKHFINPNLRLDRSKLSPDIAFPSSPNVTFVTDVTASGMEALYAITSVLNRRGIRKVGAVSLYDTSEGARELLASCHIPLTTVLTADMAEPIRQTS